MSVNSVGAPDASKTDNEFDTELDDDFQRRLRSFGVSVTVVRSEHGVVLEGVSHTFYGKQMAQEMARKANLVVLANRISVDRVEL
jgi:hypothetical protein